MQRIEDMLLLVLSDRLALIMHANGMFVGIAGDCDDHIRSERTVLQGIGNQILQNLADARLLILFPASASASGDRTVTPAAPCRCSTIDSGDGESDSGLPLAFVHHPYSMGSSS